MTPGMTPDPGNTPGADTPPPEEPRAPRPRGRQSRLDKVEHRLNDTFATIAVAQAGLGVVSGDQRHLAGGNVTAELGPQLVEAWIKLAKENPRVEKVLIRMSETTAWGEVIMASAGFMYSQAQAYGAVPPTMPNPWTRVPIVPPSPDVAAAEATPPPADWAPFDNGDAPMTGRTPPRSGVGDDGDAARDVAERQRQAAEQQRLQQLRGRG